MPSQKPTPDLPLTDEMEGGPQAHHPRTIIAPGDPANEAHELDCPSPDTEEGAV